MLAEHAKKHADARPMLYRAVAEIIRSRLDPADARVVAAWFDRLAAGEDAADVFPKKRSGRPTTIGRDYDIAWTVHQLHQDNDLSIDDACKRVAEDSTRTVKDADGKDVVVTIASPIDWKTIRNIYGRHRAELEKLRPKPKPTDP